MNTRHRKLIDYLLKKYYHTKIGLASHPVVARRVHLNLTTRCNFCCPHCFRQRQDRNKRIQKDIPLFVVKEILSQSKLLLGINQVAISGGEPTLHPELESILRLAKQLGYYYSFTTNGFLFRDFWRIVEKIDYPPLVLSLSLDGPTAEVHNSIRNQPGSFSRVINAVNFFKKNNIILKVNVCLNRDNIQYLEKFVFLCRELKVNILSFIGMIPFGAFTSVLSDEEKEKTAQKIIEIKEKMRGSLPLIQFVASLRMPNYLKADYCGHLLGYSLNFDPWGGINFCLDIYEDIPERPLIQKDGFLKSLGMMLDMFDEMKKQRVNDLARNNFFAGFNDCRYCNKYAPSIIKKIRKKWN